MLRMIGANVAFAAVAYGVEKAFDAGIKGYQAFRAARAERNAPVPPMNFTKDNYTDLKPYRVEVGIIDLDNSKGMAVHEIYAQDSDDAMSWALRFYSHLPADSLQIRTFSVH